MLGARRGALTRRTLDAGTRGGAQSLGLETAQGLVVGAPADCAVIRLSEPDAWGMPGLEAVAFAGQTGWVDQLFVGGKALLQSGRHPRRAAIRDRAEAIIRRTLT